MEGPLTDIRNSISSLSGFKEEFSCGDDSQAGADSLWRLCSLHPWRFKRPGWMKPWGTWSDLVMHPSLSRRLSWRTLEVSSKLNHPGILSVYRQWTCNRNLLKFRTWPGILSQNSPAPVLCVVSRAVVPCCVFAGLVMDTLHKELQPWGLHSRSVTLSL